MSKLTLSNLNEHVLKRLNPKDLVKKGSGILCTYRNCDCGNTEEAFAFRMVGGKGKKPLCLNRYITTWNKDQARYSSFRKNNPEYLEKNRSERVARKNNPITHAKDKLSVKNFKMKVNTRCNLILSGIKVLVYNFTKLREEKFRFSFYDLFLDIGLGFINESPLREKSSNRSIQAEDTYIPALKLWISFKRNETSDSPKNVIKQFRDNRKEIKKKYPDCDYILIDIDGSLAKHIKLIGEKGFNAFDGSLYLKHRLEQFHNAECRWDVHYALFKLNERAKLFEQKVHLMVA